MVLSKQRRKKKNFAECEIQVLVKEVERRRRILFNGASMGVSTGRKRMEWQRVCVAVNAVSAVHRSTEEVKKKWFDMKMLAKKRISAHRESVGAAGRSVRSPPLSALDERLAFIMEDIQPCGELPPPDECPDTAEPTSVKAELEDEKPGVLSGEEVPEYREEVPEVHGGVPEGGHSAAGPSSISGETSGRVPTDSALQTQRDLVRSIESVTTELKHIGSVLCQISSTLKELVKTYTVFV
ncbi:myb/SANT-like DNA-binding domain-containing protein 4 [Conger conger]|uniref:myb/SANT-like DNA-binding domain-containing protein 4 n=1 Tax=Conger conger TaxID=82655 RepID=UPI002A5A5EFA|nr:myb/SANT-like DNA-binding domain-containing protein 4 [Conger conger]